MDEATGNLLIDSSGYERHTDINFSTNTAPERLPADGTIRGVKFTKTNIQKDSCLWTFWKK